MSPTSVSPRFSLESTQPPVLQGGRVFAYSNRPPVTYDEHGKIKPNLSGGAVRVILDAGTQCWIGPGRAMSREAYDALSEEEKFPVRPVTIKQDGLSLEMYLFPYPEELQKKHYDFSNTKIWPVLHSTDPLVFDDPIKASERLHVPERYPFNYTVGQCREGWRDYKAFSALANTYIGKLREARQLRKGDCLIIHDYQCADVEGDVMAFHTPQTTVDHLNRLRLPRQAGEKSNTAPFLGEEGYYRDYLHAIVTRHKALNFQRPSDQERFYEQLAAVYPNFRNDNPALFERGQSGFATKGSDGWKAITPPLGNLSATEIVIRDASLPETIRLKTMNIPVGTSQQADIEEAKTHVGLFDLDAYGKPRDPDLEVEAKRFGAEVFARGGIALAEDADKTFPSAIRPLLQEGHHLIVNAHRDDPSKNALAQLDAIEHFFTDHPEALGTWHAVLVLPDSRDTIAAYKRYGVAVMEHAARLRERLNAEADRRGIDRAAMGDPLVTFPAELPHGELMGLLRHPNTSIKLEGAEEDGHALTLREPFNVRADWSRSRLLKHPLAVVAATGVGATDITGGNREQPGTFTFPTYRHHASYAKAMAGAIGQAYQCFRSEKGREELVSRYEVGRVASAHYTGVNYGRTIIDLAEHGDIGDIGPERRPESRNSGEPALKGIVPETLPVRAGDWRGAKPGHRVHDVVPGQIVRRGPIELPGSERQ